MKNPNNLDSHQTKVARAILELVFSLPSKRHTHAEHRVSGEVKFVYALLKHEPRNYVTDATRAGWTRVSRPQNGAYFTHTEWPGALLTIKFNETGNKATMVAVSCEA